MEPVLNSTQFRPKPRPKAGAFSCVLVGIAFLWDRLLVGIAFLWGQPPSAVRSSKARQQAGSCSQKAGRLSSTPAWKMGLPLVILRSALFADRRIYAVAGSIGAARQSSQILRRQNPAPQDDSVSRGREHRCTRAFRRTRASSRLTAEPHRQRFVERPDLSPAFLGLSLSSCSRLSS